jgi:hypothetical protein
MEWGALPYRSSAAKGIACWRGASMGTAKRRLVAETLDDLFAKTL